jgi:hypothetical protein
MKRSFSSAPPPDGAAVTSTAATVRLAAAAAMRPRPAGCASLAARRLRVHATCAPDSGAAAADAGARARPPAGSAAAAAAEGSVECIAGVRAAPGGARKRAQGESCCCCVPAQRPPAAACVMRATPRPSLFLRDKPGAAYRTAWALALARRSGRSVSQQLQGRGAPLRTTAAAASADNPTQGGGVTFQLHAGPERHWAREAGAHAGARRAAVRAALRRWRLLWTPRLRRTFTRQMRRRCRTPAATACLPQAQLKPAARTRQRSPRGMPLRRHPCRRRLRRLRARARLQGRQRPRLRAPRTANTACRSKRASAPRSLLSRRRTLPPKRTLPPPSPARSTRCRLMRHPSWVARCAARAGGGTCRETGCARRA